MFWHSQTRGDRLIVSIRKGHRTASFDMSCLMLKLKLFGCWRFFLDYDWTMINHVDDFFFSKLWVDHDSMLRFGETSSCSNHVLCGLWKGRKNFSHILPFLDQMKIFMLTWHFWWLTGLRLQHLAHPGGRSFWPTTVDLYIAWLVVSHLISLRVFHPYTIHTWEDPMINHPYLSIEFGKIQTSQFNEWVPSIQIVDCSRIYH